MLVIIDPGFALFVPLEAHGFSVRTLCAYVNRDAVKPAAKNWSPSGPPTTSLFELAARRPGPIPRST
jgi:hypothetical protein